MEKLFVRVIIVLLVNQLTYAQDSLCVYNVRGIVTKNNKNKLQKGRTIHKNEYVNLEANSKLTAIDNRGNLFIANKSGIYSYEELLSLKINNLKNGFTTQYFKFIWSELNHQNTKEEVKGVVFRGNIFMTYPPNHSKVYGNKIILEWTSDAKSLNYIFIKNKETGIISKFESNGNYFGFNSENPFLRNQKEFEWSVTNIEFPNLENLYFNSFKLISEDKYEEEINKLKELINELNEIGLDEFEIKNEICRSFSLCDNLFKK